MNNLTLIIPAKNEAESLPLVLEELVKHSYRFIIVLHKSDVDTIKSIEKYSSNIIFQNNSGYGDALISGIKQCKTELFCVFNADSSFNPSKISKMLDKLKNQQLDFIFASRYEKNGGSDDDTLITLIGNYIFSLIGKLFFRLPISDILYTFLIGNTQKAKSLNLNQRDFCFCVELPIKARRKNMKIKLIESYERKRIAGLKKVNAFRDGYYILKYMVRLFFSK